MTIVTELSLNVERKFGRNVVTLAHCVTIIYDPGGPQGEVGALRG